MNVTRLVCLEQDPYEDRVPSEHSQFKNFIFLDISIIYTEAFLRGQGAKEQKGDRKSSLNTESDEFLVMKGKNGHLKAGKTSLGTYKCDLQRAL